MVWIVENWAIKEIKLFHAEKVAWTLEKWLRILNANGHNNDILCFITTLDTLETYYAEWPGMASIMNFTFLV